MTGGFALAAQWAWGEDHKVLCFCEMDKFCRKVLNKHWPDVPIVEDVRDVKSIKKYASSNVDIISGGYPCQAFSTASHGRIVSEDLSPLMLDIVEKIQPRFIIAENVQERTIDDFKSSIKSIGYGAFVRSLSAHDVGADHIRNRWFCIAYPHNKGEFQSSINAKMAVLQGIPNPAWGWKNYSRIVRISNGVSNRMDRLKSLGNSVVLPVAYEIMMAIKDTDNENVSDPLAE